MARALGDEVVAVGIAVDCQRRRTVEGGANLLSFALGRDVLAIDLRFDLGQMEVELLAK